VQIRLARLGVGGKGEVRTGVAGVEGCRGVFPAVWMGVEVMAHCSGLEGRKGGGGCWRLVVVGDQCGRRVVVAVAGVSFVSHPQPSGLVMAWETRRRTFLAVAGWSCTWWQP
jgi:hypothetical protein